MKISYVSRCLGTVDRYTSCWVLFVNRGDAFSTPFGVKYPLICLETRGFCWNFRQQFWWAIFLNIAETTDDRIALGPVYVFLSPGAWFASNLAWFLKKIGPIRKNVPTNDQSVSGPVYWVIFEKKDIIEKMFLPCIWSCRPIYKMTDLEEPWLISSVTTPTVVWARSLAFDDPERPYHLPILTLFCLLRPPIQK